MDLYYKPTKGELFSDPDFFSKFKGGNALKFPTEGMPNHPIKPEDLSSIVTQCLSEFDNIISNGTDEQIKAICRVFNSIIQMNQDGVTIGGSGIRYIYPAQTGSAKSLSLKVYVSLLEKESSLIVVSKVEEAIEYCNFINMLKNDSQYAKCHYTITDKNKDNEHRIERSSLKDYRCIVISHAMFQNINQSSSIDSYKYYKDKQRDLVVVDEKINFYTSTKVSFTELYKLRDIIHKIREQKKIDDERLSIVDVLIEVIELTLQFNEDLIESPLNDINEYMEVIDELKEEDLKLIEEICIDRITELLEELKEFTSISSKKFHSTIHNDTKNLIERIKNIFFDEKESNISIYTNNYEQCVFKVKNIINKLGSCVVLDATASFNEFYKVAYNYSHGIYEVETLNTRKYSNLTLYKTVGYRQGRTSTYSNLSKEERQFNAKMYMSHAMNILIHKEDKLLVITHKGFKKDLLEECNDKRIVFTHWGDHIGKNDWNDCNKVMVIGWNFINEQEHIYSIFNAVGNSELANLHINKKLLSDFNITQVADDLVQGVMRTQARKIATLDGDCKKTEVYIYYEDIEQYNNTIDLFVSQFPEVKVVEWTPTGISKQPKKTKPNKKVDMMIDYLQEQEAQGYSDVMLKEVIQETGINKATASRIINSNDYFKDCLDKKGYKIKNSDGKSMYFVLK